MIRISIPASVIPNSEKHEVDTPIYVKGQFSKFTKNLYVSLTSEFVLDDKYDPNHFYIEVSGNEFMKLVERDILPTWATPELLIEWSSAKCKLSEDRKVIWFDQ